MNTVYLVANGDLRLSANQKCEPAQAAMEKALVEAIQKEGFIVKRAHPFDQKKGHGFIDSQKMGIQVFHTIPKDAPVVVAEAVWQYSQHILPGLFAHQGPKLTVANWSGTWPGLVGLLNLNGGLTKAGIKYSSLWSEEFRDKFFVKKLRQWLASDKINHDTSHVMKYKEVKIPGEPRRLGERLASSFRQQQWILGVFDEGCMGMYNAIIPDELLSPLGIFKERLSQSTLYARMLTIPDEEARRVYDWLVNKGVKFHYGPNEETDLTEAQVLQQCKMYVAATRIASEFGCDAIGIQYQQGLKDMTPASDLAEGLLNNTDRPPVYHKQTGKELFPGRAVPHFNEVDEGAGGDALVTNRVWTAMGLAPDTTLHDIRWGRHYKDNKIDDFVWVFEISGAAPPSHFVGGYEGASSERQPAMYFPLGGGTLKGESKPGEIVWSRVYVQGSVLHVDMGRGTVVGLPPEEMQFRWKSTTPQWPIMSAVLHGVSRDQLMGRHKANHIQVAYGNDADSADAALLSKAVAFRELGVEVFLCGREVHAGGLGQGTRNSNR